MIRARVKDITPSTRVVNEDTRKWVMFINDMACFIGKELDFERTFVEDSNYILSPTSHNKKIIGGMDYLFRAEWHESWIEPLTREKITDPLPKASLIKESILIKLKIPDWIVNILEREF
jgi:hypothetical protein